LAYDFLGTFNKSQWEGFLAFARSQLPLVEARVAHLTAERLRVGIISFTYGTDGLPQDFQATPSTSYLAKLLAAYEVLGGNPFVHLRVRAKSQPVYMIRGGEQRPTQFMSNGEVIGAKGLADAPSAELMRDAQVWLNDTLKARFGRLERKIRRMVDYSDELQNEVVALEAMTGAIEIEGSLENIAQQVTSLLSDPGYRAIFDDQGKDVFGLTTYAPFSSYDIDKPADPNAGVSREGVSGQRQDSGYVGPGEQG